MEYIHHKYLLIGVLCVLFFENVQSQNVGVSSTAFRSGNVKLGQTIIVEVWINNNSSNLGPVLPYRLKPQITYSENLQLAETGHELPEGWKILSNIGGDVRLTNGTDSLPPNERRIIKLALIGKKISTKETVTTNLLFSNGKPPGETPGPPITGDLQSDNTSAVILKVIQ